jgi:hypothetical protein
VPNDDPRISREDASLQPCATALRGFGWESGRDNIDQVAKLAIRLVRGAMEPAGRGEKSEPHISLALARADERGSRSQSKRDPVYPQSLACRSLQAAESSLVLQAFERLGVVQVDDPTPPGCACRDRQPWLKRRREHDFGLTRRLLQAGRTTGLVEFEGLVIVDRHAPGWRSQDDVVLE